MYARNYSGPVQEMKIPQNYDGTALKNSENLNTPPHEPDNTATSASADYIQPTCKKNPWEGSNEGNQSSKNGTSSSNKTSFLGGLFDGTSPLLSKINISSIGTEEILIICTALFLLLSKNNDLESAIILLLLLFVK